MELKTKTTFEKENFGGGAPAEALSRPIVEQIGRPVNLFARRFAALAFGKEFPEQAIGVFVRPATPALVRRREIRLDPQRRLDFPVLGEFGKPGKPGKPVTATGLERLRTRGRLTISFSERHQPVLLLGSGCGFAAV
jgi:hypothetical protein